MRNWFREGFYAGVGLALLIALFLIWLWQPERQVSRHAKNLLREIEQKDWSGVADFIDADYNDQWGDDRSLMLARIREVFRYVRSVRIIAADPVVTIDNGAGRSRATGMGKAERVNEPGGKSINGRGVWRAKVTIDGDSGEAVIYIKERVNSLATPFELEWRHASAKPWDWKLVRVRNRDLEIPSGLD